MFEGIKMLTDEGKKVFPSFVYQVSIQNARFWKEFAQFCLLESTQGFINMPHAIVHSWKTYSATLPAMPMLAMDNPFKVIGYIEELDRVATWFDYRNQLRKKELYKLICIYDEDEWELLSDIEYSYWNETEIQLLPFLKNFYCAVVNEVDPTSISIIRSWQKEKPSELNKSIRKAEQYMCRLNEVLELRNKQPFSWLLRMDSIERRGFIGFYRGIGIKKEHLDKVKLLEILCDGVLAERKNNRGLTIKELYSKWMPSKKWDSKEEERLVRVISEIQKELENFLILEDVKMDNASRALALAKAVKQKGWTLELKNAIKEGRQELQKRSWHPFLYGDLLVIEELELETMSTERKEDRKAQIEVILSILYDHLIMQGLRLGAQWENEILATGKRELAKPAQAVLDFAWKSAKKQVVKSQEALIKFWLLLFEIRAQNDGENLGFIQYKQAFNILSTLSDEWANEIKREAWLHLLNHANQSANSGLIKYHDELKKLYDFAKDRELLFDSIENANLSKALVPTPSQKNVVSARLLQTMIFMWTWNKRMDLARTTLEDYGSHLPISEGPLVLLYFEGLVEYYEANYVSALAKLGKVKTRHRGDIAIRLGAYMYYYRTLVELNNNAGMQEIIELQETYRRFLNRAAQKIGESKINPYKHFLNIIVEYAERKMQNGCNLPLTPSCASTLENKMGGYEVVRSRPWILRKIHGL